MNRKTWALTAALTLAPLGAVAQQHAGHDHAAPAAPSKAAKPAKAAKASKGAARTVELTVTSEGFVPAEVKVKKGEKIRLAVTRKVERTCATEIVMKDQGVNQPLPLDKTVYVELTPAKTGKIKYACGMDMIAGHLVVE